MDITKFFSDIASHRNGRIGLETAGVAIAGAASAYAFSKGPLATAVGALAAMTLLTHCDDPKLKPNKLTGAGTSVKLIALGISLAGATISTLFKNPTGRVSAVAGTALASMAQFAAGAALGCSLFTAAKL